GFTAILFPFTASPSTPLSTPWVFRTVPPAIPELESSFTHAWTSSYCTSESFTAPHRGRTCALRIERFLSRVESAHEGVSHHALAIVSTSTRPRAGSTYCSGLTEVVTSSTQNWASSFSLKCLACSFP